VNASISFVTMRRMPRFARGDDGRDFDCEIPAEDSMPLGASKDKGKAAVNIRNSDNTRARRYEYVSADSATLGVQRRANDLLQHLECHYLPAHQVAKVVLPKPSIPRKTVDQ
jgi:hypothetical protein